MKCPIFTMAQGKPRWYHPDRRSKQGCERPGTCYTEELTWTRSIRCWEILGLCVLYGLIASMAFCGREIAKKSNGIMGYCADTGLAWKSFDMDSSGARGYTSRKGCGNTYPVGFPMAGIRGMHTMGPDVGQIEYKRGYKYQLSETYSVDVWRISATVSWSHLIFAALDKTNGILQIERGYAWDGPSGPTIDTKTFMRASLVHDALYQMIRLGVLDKSLREHADKLMRIHCKEDGMNRARAWWVYWALRLFAGKAAIPESRKKVITAPE